jgi:thiamine biosynthesis lipoprotein
MIKRTIPALGTFVEISLPKDVDKGLFEKAFETLALVEEKLSFFNPTSDVSRINVLPPNVTLKIHPHTYTVLNFAQELSTQSDGIFDITIAKILEKNGFLPPSVSETRSGDYRDIILLENSCVMLTQKVSIDLGGVAKGYGVDCAIRTLKEYEIPYGSVNAGGDLRVFGIQPQPLYVRHPILPHQTIYLGEQLCNNAAATSAGYYSRSNGIMPTVNPKTQECINNFDSITVLAPTCMIADALTKIFMINPANDYDLLSHYNARVFLMHYNETTNSVEVFDSKTH